MLRIRVTTLPDRVFEWESQAPQFLIGRADTCALRFEGESAGFVSWEHAEFKFGPDGLPYVTDIGSTNGTYVDGIRINAHTPTSIRVGSTFQMGRAGPMMEVLDVTRAAARPVSAPYVAPAPSAALSGTQARSAMPATPTGPASSRSLLLPKSPWHQHPAVICGGIALLVAVGYLIANRATSSREPSVEPAPIAAASSNPPAQRSEGNSPAPVATIDPPRPPVVAPQPVAAPEPTNPVPADPWKDAGEQTARSLRMIVVEDPKTHAAWPFAGATFVGDRVLLTTATIAVELSNTFIDRGWRVTVMKDSQADQIAIKDVRVHAAFQQESVAEQLYFDMALLYVEERSAEPIPQASAAELAELEKGLPLACIAIDHAGDPLDRFQQLRPKTYPGKIFAVTSLPPQPGGPQLLHLRGSYTDKARGSPVVNERGHLVALYCEPAQAPDSAPVTLAVHYAKVIQPALIELGSTGPDDKGDAAWDAAHC